MLVSGFQGPPCRWAEEAGFLSSQEGGGSGLGLVLDWRWGRPRYPRHWAPSFLQPDFQSPIPSLPEGQPK